MDREVLSRWIAAYERLWRTAGTDRLRDLFCEDASYSVAPFTEPHRGLKAIERFWQAEREGPDEEFTFTAEVIAVEGDTGVARVHVRYGEPRAQEYRDLWVIALGEDGRCTRFEEWPFWPPGTDGRAAGGAETGAAR